MLRRRTSKDILTVRTKAFMRAQRHPYVLNQVAIQALSQTITLLTQQGRFRQAADREKEVAQIYIRELQDLKKGCESLERAGEWYAQEDAAACVS